MIELGLINQHLSMIDPKLTLIDVHMSWKYTYFIEKNNNFTGRCQPNYSPEPSGFHIIPKFLYFDRNYIHRKTLKFLKQNFIFFREFYFENLMTTFVDQEKTIFSTESQYYKRFKKVNSI